MSILQTLRQKAGFTRNEMTVILFLSSTLCVGSALKYLAPGKAGANVPFFDYAQVDSEYVTLSKAASDLAGKATESPAGGSRAKTKPLPAKGGININTATAEELTLLPGVGPATAARIVQYRQEHGKFASVDDLANVKGIGPKRLENLRPYARIR